MVVPLVSTTLPVEDPILIFALAMIVFLLAPLALARYKLPGIIGIILVGAAIGPNGIGILDRDATFVLLGEVGLVYLMFVAGLEINFNQFIRVKDRSIVFGTISFLIPQAAATIVGVAVLDLSLLAALLFGTIISSHTLLAYPVVSRLGIAKNEAITATIGGTILTDTAALLVLAIVIAAFGGALGITFWIELGLGLALLFVGIWLLVPRLGLWFFQSIDQESYFDFLFVMVVLFVCAYAAEVAGVKHIIGAFLAGLALNRLISQTSPLMNRIEFVGNALFIPFFLISVGMLVDVRVLIGGIDTVTIAGSLIVLVVVTKFVAAWMTGQIYQYTGTEIIGMYGLSMGQAAAALAIVLIGFDEGIPGFDQPMVNGVVLMILVISLISPALVERSGKTIRAAATEAPGEQPIGPQRILVPFSRQSKYREQLLDFAMLVRGSTSDEPLVTVSVVENLEDADAEVAAIGEELAKAERYAAGAEVPVESRVQVDTNVASGIVRAIVENRITTVVIGWDGARSRRQHVFGSVIDQIIRRTRQLMFVTRSWGPLETTERLVVLLPPNIDHSHGFAEAIYHLNHLADSVEAPLHAISVRGNPDRYERLFERVGPEMDVTVESVHSFDELLEQVDKSVTETDFVCCLSARRGTIGWHSELETLPGRIARTADGNFAIVYPATGEETDGRQFLGMA